MGQPDRSRSEPILGAELSQVAESVRLVTVCLSFFSRDI